jgi:hypothetical protein
LLRRDRLAWGLRAFLALLVAWIVLDGVGDLGVAVVAAALGAALAAALTPVGPPFACASARCPPSWCSS